jgi:transcriptional regulator GlxA family with amidase domain
MKSRIRAVLVSVMALALGGVVCAAAPQNMRKKVAILVFDGAEIIDYAGPSEVFGAQDDQFNVFTVAPTTSPVTTGQALKIVPTYSLANAPQADILVIPGGMVGCVVRDEAVLNWIKAQSAHTLYTMSVCSGAFILANTGLLDGLSATTTRSNIKRLREEHPQIRVVGDQRLVDNGKIITTGGTSAGIDGALHVVGKMSGNGNAQALALVSGV